MMKALFERLRGRLPRGRLVRGTMILAGSNALSQALSLAAAPLLTRLYTPADFGLLAVYMSVTTVLGVVLALRYELAVPLPETTREALAIVWAAIACVVMLSAISLIVVLFFREGIADLLNAPSLAPMLFLLPLGLLLLGSFNVFRYWCIRVGAFLPIGKARLVQVLSSLTIQIAGASFGAVALLAGQVANQGAGSLSLGRIVRKAERAEHPTLAEVRHAFWRYRRFPLISSWAALLNRSSAQMPTLLFAVFFGPAIAGVYALAMRVLNTPAAVFSGAIISTFLSSAAERARDGTLPPLVEKAYRYLTHLAVPALAVIAVISPDAFRVLFGAEWEQAGQIARWVTLLVYCSIAIAPLISLFGVLERQGEDLFFQGLLFIARGAAIVLGARSGDALQTIALYSVTSLICYLIMLWRLTVISGGGGGGGRPVRGGRGLGGEIRAVGRRHRAARADRRGGAGGHEGVDDRHGRLGGSARYPALDDEPKADAKRRLIAPSRRTITPPPRRRPCTGARLSVPIGRRAA